jgi:hypothetical protein
MAKNIYYSSSRKRWWSNGVLRNHRALTAGLNKNANSLGYGFKWERWINICLHFSKSIKCSLHKEHKLNPEGTYYCLSVGTFRHFWMDTNLIWYYDLHFRLIYSKDLTCIDAIEAQTSCSSNRRFGKSIVSIFRASYVSLFLTAVTIILSSEL